MCQFCTLNDLILVLGYSVLFCYFFLVMIYVPSEDIFKFKASAAAAREFFEWVQVGIDVYIPHHKSQVKSQ